MFFSESVAPSQCLFGADVFIKTLPEWSHLNLSRGVLIMSQFLFCISSSETVYLTIKALTFSICETSARKLWMCSVQSFLLSRFPFFSPHFLSFFNLLFFLPVFHPLLFCFLPILLSSPLPRGLTSLHSVKYSRSMMHRCCTGDWTGGFVA